MINNTVGISVRKPLYASMQHRSCRFSVPVDMFVITEVEGLKMTALETVSVPAQIANQSTSLMRAYLQICLKHMAKFP